MQTDVTWSADVLARFPELTICIGTITGIHNQKENDQLGQLKKTVYEEAKAKKQRGSVEGQPDSQSLQRLLLEAEYRPHENEALRRGPATQGSQRKRVAKHIHGSRRLQSGLNANSNSHQRVRQRQAEPTVPHPLRKERGIHGNRNGQTHAAYGENAHPNRRKTGPLRLPLPRF